MQSWFIPKKYSALLILGSLTVFSFQNCAKTQFSSVELASEQKQSQSDDGQNDDEVAPGAAACTFNGQRVAHGSQVTAYQNSAVPFGSTCVSEKRLCNNGVLSGTYNYAACVPGQAKMCLFNGQSIASGSSVKAYLASTVAFGQTCKEETRICTNGQLSGQYQYGSCKVDGPGACLFNGKTINHGAKVVAYLASSVPYGQTCKSEMRTCSNSKLSGSYSYASCSEGKAASCLFNGRTVAHQETVIAYQNSSVPAGQKCVMESRTCNNGNLSGQYQYSACSAGTQAMCKFNGQDIANGGTVKAYQSSSVSFGQTCVSQTRTCTNGALSGDYSYSSCSVNGPRACLFNGRTINHGQTVYAYTRSQVAYGQSCSSYRVARTCNDSFLSGDAQAIYETCSEGTAAACYWNGRTISHGERVVGYKNTVVPYGGTCQAETRTCDNGILSGSFDAVTCAVENPHKCEFGGQMLDHGASVVAYQSTSVSFGSSCASQERRCNDGSLSGSYTAASCQVQPAPVVQDPCGDVVAEFQVRQAVTSGSRSLRPAMITKQVHQESFCSDNGWDSIPTWQRTVGYLESTSRYCMYPGLPQWYDGGRWVGMNYLSSGGISLSITGMYKIVRTPNWSWAPGHETVRQFASRNGLTFIQAPGESHNIDSLYVCKRAPSSGGGGGSNPNYDQAQE